MNGRDYAILALLVLPTFFAVRDVIRRKKRGGCCGDCGGCTHARPGCKK